MRILCLFFILILISGCIYETKDDILLKEQNSIRTQIESITKSKVGKIDIIDSNYIKLYSKENYLILKAYDCAKYIYESKLCALKDSLNVTFITKSDTIYFEYKLKNFESEGFYLSQANTFFKLFQKKDFKNMRKLFEKEYNYDYLANTLSKTYYKSKKHRVYYLGCYYFPKNLNAVSLIFKVKQNNTEDLFIIYYNLNTHKIIDFNINNFEILF